MESMVLKMRKMKDSGIEWIGEIPEGWEISKVSYFYEVQLGKMLQPQKKSETDTEEKYLCAANVGKNSLSLDTLKTMWFSQTEKHQFDLKEGDLLVVEGGDVASCAIIETPIRNLFFQNALHRVRPLHNESVAFLRYWLMTAKSYGYIDLICNKATIAHFSKEKFIALPILVIPQDIQSKIVSFLDLECKQIDDLLSKSRSSIEEYKKLKQAVITQAVTKGVRGKREMKDSGVEWIGKIPAEWSICPLKRLAAIQTGCTPSKTSSESFYSSIAGTPWIKPDNLGFSSSIETTAEFLTEEGCSVARILPSNTVYVGCIGSRIGNCGYSLIPCACNQQINALIINARMYWKYGWYLTIFQEEQYMLLANGNVIQIINSTTQGNISCIVPSISEQKEIVDYLDAKCAEIDRLIAKKEKMVKELESYKKSLIYEVVTGKREV